MCNKKVILIMAGILILLVAVVYVRSRISPLLGNYSVEKNEIKVEAKPTMDTKAQETKKQEKMETTKPQATKKPKTKKSQEKTEISSKGINSYWNMRGNGKVKFDASAGFYDEWGDIPALEYKTKMNFIKIFSPLKSFIYAGTLSFLIIVVNIQEYFANFIINILHKDVTFTGRTDIWNEALFYLKNNFIFGLGRLQSEKRTMMLGASSAHNQFLNFMFEGGIVLLGYIFIAIYCFSKRLLSCKNRKIIILFSATMFSYAFMWISEPFSYSGTFAMFFLWMLMYRAKELFSEE